LIGAGHLEEEFFDGSKKINSKFLYFNPVFDSFIAEILEIQPTAWSLLNSIFNFFLYILIHFFN
jgi:hypothetical protein